MNFSDITINFTISAKAIALACFFASIFGISFITILLALILEDATRFLIKDDSFTFYRKGICLAITSFPIFILFGFSLTSILFANAMLLLTLFTISSLTYLNYSLAQKKESK